MATKCPNREKNLQDCNCSYSGCDKKGVCCECVAYHRSMRQLPACFFNAADEASYDRSFERFVQANS